MHGKKKKSRDRRYVCVRLWVCVCVWQTERERERERERESVVCVCVCTRSPYVVQSSGQRRVFIYVTWLIHTCVAWLIYMFDMMPIRQTCRTRSVYVYELFISVTWLVLLHDSSQLGAWLIPTWDMTQFIRLNLYVWHDVHSYNVQNLFYIFTRVISLIHMCDMTHSHVRQQTIKCVTWLVPVYDSSMRVE